MAYVANTLADDEKDKADQQEALPSLGGATPAANTIGASSSPQPMSGGAPAQQQKTPQQQKGTGFVNLSSWLDAGKGRDKAIMDTGNAAKKTEQTSYDTAANTANAGFNENHVIKLGSSVKDTLDREAGVGGQTPNQNATTLSGVLNQQYTGPESIDYTAGQGMTDLRNLGKTNTVSDVLAKPEIDAGRYGAGLRSLDNVLFGADGASQNAIKNNETGAINLKAKTDAGQKGFVDKVGSIKKDMAGTAAATRAELERLGKTYTADVNQRAIDANETAAQAANPLNQVAAAPGQVSEWQGAAPGSANAGNIQTGDDQKRFAALNKLLGFEGPAVTGQYQPGKQGTRAETPEEQTARVAKAQAEAEASRPVSQEYTNKFNDGMNEVITKFAHGLDSYNPLQSIHTDQFLSSLAGMNDVQKNYLIDQYVEHLNNLPSSSKKEKEQALKIAEYLRNVDWNNKAELNKFRLGGI